ncbi:MAG: 50S ribosomal protein L11 methyltransferase [Beijerinckiaceae bacterium]|nr:50S ribosomal protein L11 methyltransferase [Beijerinckiaceae bacterium]
MSDSWKLTLPCTKAEAEAIAAAEDDASDIVLITTEEDEASGRWRLDVYFDGKPAAAALKKVRALVPSAAGVAAKPALLDDADWVTMSQSGLEPVRAGRFFVHTAAHADAVPADVRAFRIEASPAIGTGPHETTTGCLMMLDAMKRRGARVDNLIDLGTGTGLLAFAALHLWPRAYATATDIDAVSIEVTAENAEINGVATGQRQGRLALDVADGTRSALVQRRAPYDLIIANILADPLIALAPDVAAIAAPRAQVVLAGLLNRRAEDVAKAYRRQGFRLAERLVLGDWSILRLRRRG